MKNVAYAKSVWVDVHVLDGEGSLVGALTLPLEYVGADGGGGDVFLLERRIHQAGTAGPGWCSSHWTDDRRVQYRLYYEVNGRVFTDGVVHERELTSSSRITNPNA